MDKLKWKRRLSKFYPLIKKNTRKIILLYHAVGDGPQAMDVNLFAAQMTWLKQHCEVMSLTELLRPSPATKHIQVAISFDDGYACLYDKAAPILNNLNMPAIAYLNTGWIADEENNRRCSEPQLGHYIGEKFLIWPEVVQLVNQSWEMGSHGVDHLDLNQQTQDIAHTQLADSKHAIETQLQRSCDHFAYTWGRHSKPLRDMVVKNNYHDAVAAHHKILNHDNLFALPRMNIEKDYSLTDFIDIVTGKWDYLGVIHRIKNRMNLR